LIYKEEEEEELKKNLRRDFKFGFIIERKIFGIYCESGFVED